MKNGLLRGMKMDDFTFIILGATGDLTKRKLIPALYRLIENKKIQRFAIVGAARSTATAKDILSASKPYVKNREKHVWEKMEKAFHYSTLDFYQKNDYGQLKGNLSEIEKKHKLSGNRIFYLATAPQHFDVITHNLNKSKIAEQTKRRWVRVVYEKPFGHDLKSARKINKCIATIFKEQQIYRIDHYLGKELVGDISLIRFTNQVLEPLWCNKYIDSVQIILDEDIGLEGRGEFYEQYGALKDVVQNHAMQLLALMAMESPKELTGEYIRNEKAKVLSRVKARDVLLGQYQGYRNVKGVKKDSTVDTFAALHLQINNPRWKGVPFYIRAGKFLNKKETSIHLKFKKVDCLLARACPSDTNYFTIRIQPNDGFELELNSKVTGKRNEITPVKMEFCQSCRFGPNTPEAYETLLEDAIHGDQSVFVRDDEIEYAWKVIDAIAHKKHKLYSYTKGSKGPKELLKWSREHNLRWRS